MDLDGLKLIGDLLVRSGFCDRIQVNEARRRQMAAGFRRPIREIFVAMGAVTEGQVSEALNRPRVDAFSGS